MKRIQFFRTKSRACLVILLGISLLTLCLILAFSTSQNTKAANTVLWTEVDPPATSGTFASLVQGDINEDGHIDLIAGSLGYGIRGVAGDGDGTWTPLSAITTLGTWYGLALGDVNNDGKLDLVGAENGAGIYIWTGDGAGGWTTMPSPAGAGSFWSVALSDINDDGNLDIAAGSGGNAGLRVWTGDGAGVWTSASTGLPITGNYADVALGDVDRDGRPDLAAASHGSGVRAWQWDGASWSEESTGLPGSGDYYGVALGDLDNDGDLDIVASGDGVGVGAWTVNVGAAWSWSDASAGPPGLPDSGQYWDVGLSDVNNDGKLDVAATSYGGGIRVWLGNGGGAWSEESTGLPTSGSYYGLALGDFDDDGMVDLSAGQNAGVQAWVDDGTPDALGGWVQIASPSTSGMHYGVDVGDFDHDGKLDVVAATAGDGLQLWTGDGGNAWTDVASWTNPDLPTTGTYHTPALADIDNDGYLDVIVSRGTAGGIQVWRYINVGWQEASTGLPGTETFGDLDTGDFDGDGYVDFVAVGEGQGIRAWRGNGGTSWALTVAGLPIGPTYYSVALGDVDRDGNLDIVAGSNGSGIDVWQGMGTGWSIQTPPPTASGSWWGIALGDVNDDGDLDIVATADDNGVAVWTGDGAFGWTSLTGPATSGDFWGLDLGDFNNDGSLDVAAGTFDDKGMLVWAGDGGSNWVTYTANLPVTGKYPAVRFGEIDNDGSLDLVGAKQGSGSVHAWTSAENAPPSGWANFSPAGWVTSRAPMTLSIEVLDSGSGLNPNSAMYSTWEGAAWSSWKPASCTGSPGVTTTQTISAIGVVFTQDSGPFPHTRNQIRFRVSDMAGNTGYSSNETVLIDATPPTNPTTFPSSPHHAGGSWQTENEITVENWTGDADATSGVSGFSYVFSTAYELPDTIPETGGVYRVANSGSLPDGEWYIHMRTRDAAGNWAADASFDGPYRIDTGPPTNPTGFASSHERWDWSNDNTVRIDWSGAVDGGSGVRGYGFSWTESPLTEPDEILKGTDTYTISPPLDDGNSWYFHIKTQDHAGNWTADAAHWGPFYIDKTAPSAWFTYPSGGEANSNPFNVGWNGYDLAGIASFDVQTSTNGIAWNDWQMGTESTSASFTGVRGSTYYFRLRARDNVGNVSDWSAAYDVAVGVDVTVRVEDEEGTPLGGAKVYRNGREMVTTPGSGTVTLNYTLLDDELTAKYLIEEYAASKGHHDGWSYRTHITSVDFDDDGDPQLHTVSNTYATQVLTVRRDNPLIGFHILVSVEWDANSAFLNQVLSGFQSASAYLFDLSDGQMLWESIEIVDTGRDWGDSDYHIHASNAVWPHVPGDGGVGGIWRGSGAHVQLGRYFDGSSSNQGDWDQSDGYRTTVHEFGHYGLNLYDEYLDSDGVEDGGCTTDRATTPGSEQACFMDHQFTATEICSLLPTHPHNADTHQHAMHGEPCWNTIWRLYRDDGTDRWILERPPDRGSIMPGPTSIPVADWMYYTLDNWFTGACPPFDTSWVYPDGSPAAGFQVWVENGGTLSQGQTDADGRITILGAHDGDTVRVRGGDCGWFCEYSGSTTASCPDGLDLAKAAGTVAVDPFGFELDLVPGDSDGVVEISAKASAILSTTPQVQVWQDGLTEAITVTLAYDSVTGGYTGTAILSPTLGLKGQLWGQATDTEGHTVTVLVPFNVEQVSSDEHVWLRSGDGNFELYLKPGSLGSDAMVSILPSNKVSLTQGSLVMVGSAYEVTVSSGEYALSQMAAVNVYYHAEMVANVVTNTMQIYYWDDQAKQWVSSGGTVAPDRSLVSTRVDHLSTFAIMGEKADLGKVYLPVVLKN